MKAESIVLVGPPGVGKGTQGNRIARQGRIPYVNMSDVIRANFRKDPALEREAKALMARRELLPDDVTNRLWFEAVMETLKRRGYHDLVIDGFPRTAKQFDFMRDRLLTLDVLPVVVIFEASYEVTNQRRLDRVKRMREKGIEPRPDDLKEEIHRVGYETYLRELEGILARVRACGTCHHMVNAEGDPDKIFKEVTGHFHLPHINTNIEEGELV